MKKRIAFVGIAFAFAAPQVSADSSPFGGVFVGPQLGYAKATTTHDDNNNWYNNFKGFETTDSSAIGGARGGYNWVMHNFVYGVFGEFSLAKLDTVEETTPGSPTYQAGSEITGLGSVRGRVGYATGNMAFLFSAGLAIGQIKNRQGDTDGSNETIDENGNTTGTVFGLTAEYAFSKNATLGLDISRYTFGKSTHEVIDPVTGPTGYTFSFEESIDTIMFSYNFKF